MTWPDHDYIRQAFSNSTLLLTKNVFPLCIEPETMLRQGGNSFYFTDKGVFKLNTWIPTTNIWIKYFFKSRHLPHHAYFPGISPPTLGCSVTKYLSHKEKRWSQYNCFANGDLHKAGAALYNKTPSCPQNLDALWIPKIAQTSLFCKKRIRDKGIFEVASCSTTPF